MRSHHIAGRLVQDQIDEVKLNHEVEARREVMKKLPEVSVRGDRL
jgi:hypothetical protein